MKERLIDNCILYVLGIFLMIGMSGWVRPVIVVLIALLHITLSDLIPGKRLRYIEMGAFVGAGAAMPEHALMLFLPLLLYDCVRLCSWKAGVITGAGVLCQMVWFVQGEIGVFRFVLWCFTLILAAIFSVRTERSLKLAQEVIHLKDSSTELRLAMQKRQQDLLEKQDYEIQLLRALSNTPLQVNVTCMNVSSHVSKHTSASHINKYYTTFEAVRNMYFDGLIITGAPVETMEFEEVSYWEELASIMEWSKTNVTSTFHICWGALAGLYYHNGIQKTPTGKKLSGVYSHRLLDR